MLPVLDGRALWAELETALREGTLPGLLRDHPDTRVSLVCPSCQTQTRLRRGTDLDEAPCSCGRPMAQWRLEAVSRVVQRARVA